MMIFTFFLNLIIYNFLINDKLSEDFYHRILAIILLFSGIFVYICVVIIETIAGIGIYSGLFNLTTISQILETFLLTIGSIILIFSFYKTLNKKIFIQLLLIFCIANIIYITKII